jgi:hypothetical protein
MATELVEIARMAAIASTTIFIVSLPCFPIGGNQGTRTSFVPASVIKATITPEHPHPACFEKGGCFLAVRCAGLSAADEGAGGVWSI